MDSRPLPSDPGGLTASEHACLDAAIALALEAEREGNLPIAAVVALGDAIVARAPNRTLVPSPHPGRHAEMEALSLIPEHLIPRLPEMTCYTTLEPCVMCFGTLVTYGVGRVVYGAADPRGGAVSLRRHLPADVAAMADAIRWVGPARPDECDPLYERAARTYWGA